MTIEEQEKLNLKRIVRENHGTPIYQAQLFTNVLATVSPQQVNIYDNEHCGNHLDIMCTFVPQDVNTLSCFTS